MIQRIELKLYNCIKLEKYTFQPTVVNDDPLVFLSRIERIKGAHTAKISTIIGGANAANILFILVTMIGIMTYIYVDNPILNILRKLLLKQNHASNL